MCRKQKWLNSQNPHCYYLTQASFINRVWNSLICCHLSPSSESVPERRKTKKALHPCPRWGDGPWKLSSLSRYSKKILFLILERMLEIFKTVSNLQNPIYPFEGSWLWQRAHPSPLPLSKMFVIRCDCRATRSNVYATYHNKLWYIVIVRYA